MSESDFNRRWREFADADKDVQAPARLRRSVMAAWAARDSVLRETPSRRHGLLATAAAAVIALAVGAAIVLPYRTRELAHPVERAVSHEADPATAAHDAMAAPVVRLVADAALENEPLQVIRVRLPRASLSDLGIAPGEAEASSLVDVDVVVGSDGLPRAIRHIGPAFDLDRQ